jgi:hypothetical protein
MTEREKGKDHEKMKKKNLGTTYCYQGNERRQDGDR